MLPNCASCLAAAGFLLACMWIIRADLHAWGLRLRDLGGVRRVGGVGGVGKGGVIGGTAGRQEWPGASVVLSTVIAGMKAGACFDDAWDGAIASLSHDGDCRIRDSGGRLDADLLYRQVESCASHGEEGDTRGQLRMMCDSLAAASSLSERLGCSMATCVESVRSVYLRLRLQEDLKRNAFATPRATVRLLSLLPVVTLALGQLLGAHPIRMMLSSPIGFACLVLGAGSYALGMWWNHVLLDELA